MLALGADLKNTVTLVVDGQAFMSQHIGDLEDARTRRVVPTDDRGSDVGCTTSTWQECWSRYDAHPELSLDAHGPSGCRPRQSHRSSTIARMSRRCSPSARRGDTRVVGVSFDGTGYGDDGSIWGGELFVGSVRDGFERVAHLRRRPLAGGDAAARHPVQAAAGFLAQLDGSAGPDAGRRSSFPKRYRQAVRLLETGVRVFPTTSTGRLFDTRRR